MSKNSTKSGGFKQRFYPLRDPDDPGKSSLIPVSEEFYHAVYPGIWRTQKKMRREKKCYCPSKQLWTCDADCFQCPYYSKDEYLSLDAEINDSNGSVRVADTIADDSAAVEDAFLYTELLRVLNEELSKLNMDARKICELIGEGKSERFIADVLDK